MTQKLPRTTTSELCCDHLAKNVRSKHCNILAGPSGHFSYLDLVTLFDLVLLGNSVGHYHSLEAGIVDARDGRSREDPVGQNGVDFNRTGRD